MYAKDNSFRVLGERFTLTYLFVVNINGRDMAVAKQARAIIGSPKKIKITAKKIKIMKVRVRIKTGSFKLSFFPVL